MKKFTIAIHGGAGTILRSSMTSEKETKYKQALQEALDAAYNALALGKSALDAVEIAVMNLENCPLFNAGRGSVFTSEGTHEMDASIMDGKTLEAGAVSMISGVQNPIQLARLVLDKSEHVFLAGNGALNFAKLMNCQFQAKEWFHDDFRYQQWINIKDTDTVQLDHTVKKEQKFGTVGAVALDSFGNIAAATSTGGMTNKKFGRIGDSPMIGAGTYANNKTCAVSCTGSGEYFIRGVVAYDVSCLMEYKGLSLEAACDEVIQNRLLKINGDGGLIAVDTLGNIALPFNTEGMYRASRKANEVGIVEIYK